MKNDKIMREKDNEDSSKMSYQSNRSLRRKYVSNLKNTILEENFPKWKIFKSFFRLKETFK